MGQRVSVVEYHAAIPLPLVGRNHVGFDLGAPRHLLIEGQVDQGCIGLGAFGDSQEGVLGHLSPPAGPLPFGQGGQRGGVTQHGGRLPERPHQVLPLGDVHPGLSPDRCVHLGQQRGGHVHVGHAPVIAGGGEAGQVGHHPTAHGHDGVTSGEAEPGESAAQALDRRQGLGSLPVGDGEDLPRQAGVHLDADVRLGHHRHPTRARDGRREGVGEQLASTVSDGDVVASLPQLHRDGDHGRPWRSPDSVAPGPSPAPDSTRSATASGERSSTSTVTAATESYKGLRTS